MVFSLASFAFYLRRRSRLLLALVIGTVIATVAGFRAKLKLSYWGLLSHCLYTISVIGGFYIYVIIDFFVSNDHKMA